MSDEEAIEIIERINQKISNDAEWPEEHERNKQMSDILYWNKLKPVDGDKLHWRATEDGWAFDIYEIGTKEIPYHLKVTFGEDTYSFGWFSDLDHAKRCAARKNDLAIRVVMEIFK